MAAIFCQALWKPCEWMSDGCVACCNGMTKACGALCSCCDEACLAMGRCCSECCSSFGACMAACCRHLENIFSKPFSGVVFVTILMSLVPFAALFYYMDHYWGAPGCPHPLDIWLLIALILFIINFIFAIYLFRRLAGTDFENPALNPKYNPQVHQEINQFHHASHFFLYDPWVCVYMLTGLFQFSWAIVGLAWASSSNGIFTCVVQSQPLINATAAGGILILCFIGIFTLGVLCSVYSGFLTVCVNDLNWWKCLCCWFYYPFFYNHQRVRERYYGNHLILRQSQPPPLVARPMVSGAVVYNQPPQAVIVQQPFRNVVPIAAPVQQPAPVQQNMGGSVYFRPAAPAPPQQYQPAPQPQPAQIVFHSPPPQAPQHNYAPAPNYAQVPPDHYLQQEQGLIQYQPNQQHQQMYQPPPPHQPAYQPPPQQFSPYQNAGAEGQEGVPYHGGHGEDPYGGGPPGGFIDHAQPVAQPLQPAQPAQAQPAQKSAASKAADKASEAAKKAADKASAAAASLKDWWNKP